jgi:LasA protease
MAPMSVARLLCTLTVLGLLCSCSSNSGPLPTATQANIPVVPAPNGESSAMSSSETPRAASTATTPAKPEPAGTDAGASSGPSPTSDAPRGVPSQGVITSTYTVQRGDTLSGIALAFDISVTDLMALNNMSRDIVRAGQTLLVRIPVRDNGPSVKLIPDSELINGRGAIDFDLVSAIGRQRGYLERYTEEIADETLSGVQIVQRVSEQTSVHPRVLLAALEFAGNWVTNPLPTGDQLLYPLGNRRTNLTGLYAQLSWAAGRLNEGYYGWRLGNRFVVMLEDRSYAFLGDGINAGTAGVQNWVAAISPRTTWRDALQDDGRSGTFIATYRRLFGDPWRFDAGLPVPAGTRQPELALPWKKGELWYITGGPHSAWGRGTPWGALDFTSVNVSGCRTLNEWVTAMADGVITRSARGEVVQSLDASGDDRAGWSVLYLHIGTRGRVAAGTRVRRGDRIGHPSCEGGISNGAHLHVVRRFNGEWINATGAIPFVMGGWQAAETGAEYDGYVSRGREKREACECKRPAVNGVTW